MAEIDLLTQRELFGGAILATLPSRMEDISNVRPVPDHQEVFADGATDQSLIVEVLDRADVADEQCAAYFWADWCSANEAEDAQLLGSSSVEVSQLPAAQCSSAYQWQGVFKASKGRQDMAKANTVHTTMAVLRFPSVASDVLLVLSTPTQICSESSSAEHAGSGPQHRHHAAPALFLQILQSFAVKEWSLFGESAPV